MCAAAARNGDCISTYKTSNTKTHLHVTTVIKIESPYGSETLGKI